MLPTTQRKLHQDSRPLQTVNNCIGRSEQGEEVEAGGEQFQCLHRKVCVPHPPPSSFAYN